MKYLLPFLLLSGCCLTAHGQEPEPPAPEPIPPVPQVVIHLPDGISDVPRDSLLMITSERPLIILQVPDTGVLKIKPWKSPFVIATKFADGDGSFEAREYDQPFIYSVTAGKSGATELLLIPTGLDAAEQIVRRVLTVGGPRPPPDPEPDPDPKPPGPVKSFRVIFVKESGQTLNAQQSAIPTAKSIREYLNAKCTPENGLEGWREFEPDEAAVNEYPTMKALWEAVRPKVQTVPSMVVEVNGHATVMAFPANVTECLATLKKYGGE